MSLWPQSGGIYQLEYFTQHLWQFGDRLMGQNKFFFFFFFSYIRRLGPRETLHMQSQWADRAVSHLFPAWPCTSVMFLVQLSPSVGQTPKFSSISVLKHRYTHLPLYDHYQFCYLPSWVSVIILIICSHRLSRT